MDRSFHLCSTTTVELWTHLAHVASSTLGARRSCGQRNRNPLAGSRSALRAYTYPAGTVNGMGEFWSTSGSSGSSINGRGTWWKHVRERLWLQWLPLPVADRRLKSNQITTKTMRRDAYLFWSNPCCFTWWEQIPGLLIFLGLWSKHTYKSEHIY